MSEFEFVFVLYSLVLGLSLVELLTGLGRTLELKLARDASGTPFAIGWLTPLLALFVILDLLSFWVFAWLVRDLVAVNAGMIFGVLVFASAYFLASRLVFPSNPENFADLDTHYFRVHRVVFAMLTTLIAAQYAFIASQPELYSAAYRPLSLTVTGILLALMAMAFATNNRKVSMTVLVLLIFRYVVLFLIR